jgi:hypothetical protein
MSPLERFLQALKDYGFDPRLSGAGWACRCPAHDDRNPSLSIHAGDDGRVLLNCHAGCTVDAVCGAIGLRPSDLFLDVRSGRNRIKPPTRSSSNVYRNTAGDTIIADSVDVDRTACRRKFTTGYEAVAELERRHGPRSATWTYHNATGDPVGLVIRWNRPTGNKEIRPIRKTKAGWIMGGMPTPRPLYALPDLLATPAGTRVYIVEGEKAADAARAVGLVATTSPHGCKSANKADWSPVAGRDVVILPDHDKAGEVYAGDATRLCMAAGAKSVRIVRLVDEWPDLPDGGDLADLAERMGGDADALSTLGRQVAALADDVKPESLEPLGPTLPSFKPFPSHTLPEPIRGFVTEAAKAIGCDASYIALPLISALASAIGNTHRIELKRGWIEPAIVWTAIVGDSGTAKSPALELALRPIRKRQHDAMKEHAEALKVYADSMAMHERDAAHWRKSKSDTPPPAKPEAPIADRCWTDDATTEALAVLLQQNPRGLLMVRDELAGWFNFDRYTGGKGGGDAAKWLEMFGGRPMVVDRKGGGTLYVPRAAVSIAGGIQPETLRRALGVENTENGLASRLLMTYPPKRCPGWTDDEIDASTEAAVAAVFDRLYTLTPETDDDIDEQLRLVTLAVDGRRAVVAWVNWHAKQMEHLSGPVGFAWAKLKGYAARLALVVHLTRWAAGDATLRDPARVDEASIAAGVTLSRWFGDEARRVYAILSESEDDRETRCLVELIQRKGGNMSGRELVQQSQMYKRVADADAALSRLVKVGAGSWVTPEQRGPGGPKARRFVLSPVYGVNVYRNPPDDNGNANPVDADGIDMPLDAGDGWGELTP